MCPPPHLLSRPSAGWSAAHARRGDGRTSGHGARHPRRARHLRLEVPAPHHRQLGCRRAQPAPADYPWRDAASCPPGRPTWPPWSTSSRARPRPHRTAHRAVPDGHVGRPPHRGPRAAARRTGLVPAPVRHLAGTPGRADRSKRTLAVMPRRDADRHDALPSPRLRPGEPVRLGCSGPVHRLRRVHHVRRTPRPWTQLGTFSRATEYRNMADLRTQVGILQGSS